MEGQPHLPIASRISFVITKLKGLPIPYIPSRLGEGYGLNTEIVNRIYKEGINFSDSDSKIKVKSMSIDDFYFNVNNFDYIRMDIEGSEVEV